MSEPQETYDVAQAQAAIAADARRREAEAAAELDAFVAEWQQRHRVLLVPAVESIGLGNGAFGLRAVNRVQAQ
jgi:hypothetical protein